MTLEIKIENVDEAEAVIICKSCSDRIAEVNANKLLSEPQAVMSFECGPEKPPATYRESTPFSRYMNSTKKEGD